MMRQPQLVVALDTQDQHAAVELAEKLRGAVPWLKVGLELFVLCGPDIITRLKDMGFKIFLDLKMYDIPNTVHGGVLSAARAGADMLTIHAQGGERMAKAAVEAAASTPQRPLVFAVTVLTSMDKGDLPAYKGDLGILAADLAHKAHQWGLHGIVSSGHEVEAIKARCGQNFLCLTPGIRPAGGEVGDQRRVMTPPDAVEAGSDYLVVGRPITRAADPVAVAKSMAAQIQRG